MSLTFAESEDSSSTNKEIIEETEIKINEITKKGNVKKHNKQDYLAPCNLMQHSYAFNHIKVIKIVT